MADLSSGQVYVPPTVQELFDLMIEDFEYAASEDGNTEVAVAKGTDDYWFFQAVANHDFILYGNIATIRPGITPEFSEDEDLERWESMFGITPVAAGGSTGKIIVTVNGTASIEDGRQLTLPNKKRLAVRGNHLNIATGSEVSVVAIDGGSDTNAPANTKVNFVDPPLNVSVEARVSPNEPLTGGTEVETEARRRERLRNKTAAAPGGLNWGHLRELAFEALPSVQDCFVYPALGGSGSVKIVPVKDIDPTPDIDDFTRAPNSTAIKVVSDYILAKTGRQDNYVVEAPAEVVSDVAIQVSIPNAVGAGGNGTGWRNATVWPPLESMETKVSVTGVTSTSVITVSATTTTPPVAGITRVAWWSPFSLEFHSRLVTAVSGSAGAWVLTLDTPLVDRPGNEVAQNDYISPDAVNIGRYGSTWRDQFRKLTPGENTSDTNRLPRANRQPEPAFTFPTYPSAVLLKGFEDSNEEVSSASYSFRTHAAAPAVSSTVDDPPNILVLRRFGVYAA